MSQYGSRINSQGDEVRENGNLPIITGERVVGNTILHFGMCTDESGNTIDTRAEIKFKQNNDATFTYMFFDSDQEWAIDKVNRELLHICTKFVTKEEYYAAVEEAKNFSDFVNKIASTIIPKAQGKSFTLKIVYKQNKTSGRWYVSFPNFPNFIEIDGETPSTLKTDPKYDFYTPIQGTEMDSETVTENASEETLF
jgi:hypothetical protein